MSRRILCPACKAMIAVGDATAVSCPDCGARVKVRQRAASEPKPESFPLPEPAETGRRPRSRVRRTSGVAITAIVLGVLVVGVIVILVSSSGQQAGRTGKEERWASPDEAVKDDGLQIRILGVSIGKVQIKDAIVGAMQSKEERLIVKLSIVNTSDTKKAEYRTWSGREFALERDYATLKDNFGNLYKRVSFGIGSHAEGGVKDSGALYPNKPLTDVLVFQLPLDKATHLDLELPAANFGGKGMIRFRIPMKSVERSPASEIIEDMP